jgi:hypothetical protein
MLPYWPCLRLWVEERCSLSDLDTMSYDTVLDLNDVLDAWHEAGRPPKTPTK